MRPVNSTLWPLKAVYFVYFAALGAFGTHYFPYLMQQGLDGAAIGVFAAAAPVAMALVPPLWGRWADRRGEATRVLRVALLGAALPMLGLPMLAAPAALFGLVALASVFRSGVVPLLDSATLTFTRAHGGDYGQVRLWGSAGFIAGAVGVGVLADWLGGAAIAWSSFVLCAAAWATAQWLPKAPREATRGSFVADWKALLAEPRFRRFLQAGFLNRLGVTTAVTFIPVHYRANGWDYIDLGTYWAVGAGAEIVVFRFASRLRSPHGLSLLFWGGTLCLVLQYTLLLVSTDIVWIMSVQLLHAFTFGGWYYAGVNYVGHLVPTRLRASGQSMAGAVLFGGAVGIGSLVVGALYERYGMHTILGFSLATATLAALGSRRVALDIRSLEPVAGTTER